MKKKKIVIISGKQYSGKDTVANFIKDVLADFKLTPLAGAIKAEFGEEKNLTYKEIERNKPLYRAELIELGNRRRSEDADYWIKRVLSEEGNIIVSDVRLKHELDTFKKLDAITVRVDADRDIRALRGKLVKEDDATETELDDINSWDYVIKNNKSIESLKEESLKVARKIEKEFSKVNV